MINSKTRKLKRKFKGLEENPGISEEKIIDALTNNRASRDDCILIEIAKAS